MPTVYATPDAAAIFDEAGGDGLDPFNNPSANADKLYFHSSQPAPHLVATYTGTFQRTWVSPKKIVLQPHGLAYTPLVFGQVTLTSASGSAVSDPLFAGWVSPIGTIFDLAGSTPVASFSSQNLQFALWFNLSVDATELSIVQINQRWAGIPGALADPVLNFSYTIRAFSMAIEGEGPNVVTNTALEITPERMEVGFGKFDSERRYIRRASPANHNLASGRTIDVTGGAFEIGQRYSFNGYVRQAYRATDQGRADAPTSTFNATVRPVKV